MISHLKKIGKHTAIFSFSSILSKGIGFLLLPLYTRYLSPADYGTLELLALMLQISAILISQGMPMALFRNYTLEYKKDEVMRAKAVNTAILYSITAASIYCSFFFIFSGVINEILFGSKDYTDLLRIISITIFLQCITFVPNALMRARLKSIQLATAQIIQLTTNISLNIYFIVFLNLGIKGVIYGNLIAALTLSGIIYGLIIRNLSFSFSLKILKEMLSFGLPFVPAGLALFVMNGSDRFFLQKFSTTEEVGLYALGYKLSLVLQFVIIEPFLLVWPSIYFPLAKEKDAKKTLARLASIFFVSISFIGLIVILLSKPIILFMAAPDFWEAYNVCYWIVPSIILYGFYNIINVGINIEKKTKMTPLIVGLSSLANIILNFLLIPKYGTTGAGISTLLSFIVMCSIAFHINNNTYPIKYHWNFIFKVLFLFTCSVLISNIIKGDNLTDHIIRFSASLGTFSVGIIASSLTNEKERRNIIIIKDRLISFSSGLLLSFFNNRDEKK